MYQWLVTLHLVGLVLFLLSHGASMWVAYRIRGERERGVIASLLALSNSANRFMYAGLLLLGVGGLGAAWDAGLLTATWIVASYAVVVAVLALMFTLGAGYYYPLREALEGTAKTPRASDEELAARLRSRRPELLTLVGVIGLVALVWLMVFKPA
jgi:Predicted integral membrane protein (DUF2269)